MIKRSLGALCVLALTGAAFASSVAPAAAADSDGCVDRLGYYTFSAHVQKLGWVPAAKSTQVVTGGCSNSAIQLGTVGQSLRLEAVRVVQGGELPVCLQAHVQNIGWQAQQCTNGVGTSIEVGTTGRSLRMEALRINLGGNYFTVRAHVQNRGWDQTSTYPQNAASVVQVGTTGQGLRLEAVDLNW